jgi:phosphatidylglycerophosphatase A
VKAGGLARAAASAVAILIGYLLHWAGGFPLLAGGDGPGGGGRGLGGGGPSRATRHVIEAAAGQWVALFPLSAGLWWMGAAPQLFPWPGWVGAFVMFRLFDVWRPGPIARPQRPDGIMLDDLIAGALAALVVARRGGARPRGADVIAEAAARAVIDACRAAG